MRPPIAIVRSVFAPAIQAINDLEQRIVAAEDDADAQLWEQARCVVEQLDAGMMSQQELAAQWINVRTGEAYTQPHVSYVAHVYRHKFTYKPRPRFRDAYNEIANAAKPHVSHNAGDNEWYTPPDLIEAARRAMGSIDLDPASCAVANRTVKASQFFSIADDGLQHRWRGNVWMNPPYAQPWIDQFAYAVATKYDAKEIRRACVLVNNATETAWFQRVLDSASAICLLKGRVQFLDPDGTPTGAPLQGQAVLYLGENHRKFHRAFTAFGTVLVRVP
jgi:phage N-6-adenine-methyltransferase